MQLHVPRRVGGGGGGEWGERGGNWGEMGRKIDRALITCANSHQQLTIFGIMSVDRNGLLLQNEKKQQKLDSNNIDTVFGF